MWVNIQDSISMNLFINQRLNFLMRKNAQICAGATVRKYPHVQGQRSPSKRVGAGAAATWCWSGCEEIPHFEGPLPFENEKGKAREALARW